MSGWNFQKEFACVNGHTWIADQVPDECRCGAPIISVKLSSKGMDALSRWFHDRGVWPDNPLRYFEVETFVPVAQKSEVAKLLQPDYISTSLPSGSFVTYGDDFVSQFSSEGVPCELPPPLERIFRGCSTSMDSSEDNCDGRVHLPLGWDSYPRKDAVVGGFKGLPFTEGSLTGFPLPSMCVSDSGIAIMEARIQSPGQSQIFIGTANGLLKYTSSGYRVNSMELGLNNKAGSGASDRCPVYADCVYG